MGTEVEARQPIILTEGSYDNNNVQELKQKAWRFSDIYIAQLTELFEVNNAQLIGTQDYDKALHDFISEHEGNLRGDYVYYPWSGVLLHVLPKEPMRTLRANRTRELINLEEQQRLNQFGAGVAGLSFGNGIALSLAYSGIESLKLADADVFETTNLNRVRVGLPSVGEPKPLVTAQEIYEINPHATVQLFEEGLSEENLPTFIDHPRLGVVFDVMDDLAMKVKIRVAAKAAKVPVVMLTSLEDSVLVDVERFDINPEAEVFHGLLGSTVDELLAGKMTEQDKAKYAMKIVGIEHISYRNFLSLSKVGSELVSRPHLFGTVSIVCGLASYIAKRIALDEDMPSLRTHVVFNELLGVKPNKADTQEARDEILKELMGRG